jgi:hypothetical protein
MRTWIERVPLGPRFAGREGNDLDRIKAMKRSGWELTVLTVAGADYVLVLGHSPLGREEPTTKEE